MFLDHRWVLFGAIRNDPSRENQPRYPYLRIIDPTNCTCATTLELDKSVVEHASICSTINITIGSGASHEEGSLTRSGGIPFALDTSRGIITANVHLRNPNILNLPRFESHVFVLDIEETLAKVHSPWDLEECYIKWKSLSPSTAVFSYSSPGSDQYRIFTRHSYAAGFFYASPIQPLVPEVPEGSRCFYIYDFNPYRQTSNQLPGTVLEDPDPETGYLESASEITREFIGGLDCWRMRFDLPAAEDDVMKCHVALTDGGVVLFEVCCLVLWSYEWLTLMYVFGQLSDTEEESITIFSMW